MAVAVLVQPDGVANRAGVDAGIAAGVARGNGVIVRGGIRGSRSGVGICAHSGRAIAVAGHAGALGQRVCRTTDPVRGDFVVAQIDIGQIDIAAVAEHVLPGHQGANANLFAVKVVGQLGQFDFRIDDRDIGHIAGRQRTGGRDGGVDEARLHIVFGAGIGIVGAGCQGRNGLVAVRCVCICHLYIAQRGATGVCDLDGESHRFALLHCLVVWRLLDRETWRDNVDHSGIGPRNRGPNRRRAGDVGGIGERSQHAGLAARVLGEGSGREGRDGVPLGGGPVAVGRQGIGDLNSGQRRVTGIGDPNLEAGGLAREHALGIGTVRGGLDDRYRRVDHDDRRGVGAGKGAAERIAADVDRLGGDRG